MENDAITRMATVQPNSIIEEIKSKYQLLDYKITFISDLADHLKKQPKSIQNNWFGGFWGIPERYQKDVLDYLTDYLNKK